MEAAACLGRGAGFVPARPLHRAWHVDCHPAGREESILAKQGGRGMAVDLGLLILRVVVGLFFLGHGSQKLFGWFGGPGFRQTSQWLSAFGLQPPRLWALAVGVVEFGGGCLLVLGLFNPLGSLGIIASMIMAIILVHWPRVWVAQGGIEYPVVNAAVATALALSGPGRYSLDALLGTGLPMPATFLVGLAVVLIGVAIALGTRARPPAAVAQPRPEERRAA